MLGRPIAAHYRFLRRMRDGRVAYAMRRPDGVTLLRFMPRR